LLSWRESALVLDPKDGENYDVRVRWPVAHGPIYDTVGEFIGGVWRRRLTT
jgi:hypothetical protein